MMNLTGDGNGLDMISLPQDIRDQVPTSNFFQRNGHERNGVAVMNNTVEKLLSATDKTMDEKVQLQGAKDLAAVFPESMFRQSRIVSGVFSSLFFRARFGS